MVKPAALRQAAGFLMAEFKMSARRACRTLGLPRSSWLYRPTRAAPTALVAKLRELADKRPKAGYRMLWQILRRTTVVNHKRVYRLYREEGLAVRRRKRKRQTASVRTLLPPATRPNERWAMDFVHDITWQGRRFRVLVVLDEFTREVLALLVDTSIGGARVVRVLEELAETRGLPEVIITDNGPEFTGKALDAWSYQRGVKLHFIRPGKPVENAYCESFNGKLRGECLNIHWFTDLADVLILTSIGHSAPSFSHEHSPVPGRVSHEDSPLHA